ncbi:polymorphic toxin-type HINT domain-containing protein [Nocardiopsis sp. CC223A]|uniref:polymorphic toxin-type HINT domain-containing protein n=1 Tax=Nocardiopsis sp. CC223A TaxID=3044051 RepID=UPI00279575D8|nr:polymorphic toxin-type HINT domain-containing protein [Nocardiopsis sp. CC223A]
MQHLLGRARMDETALTAFLRGYVTAHLGTDPETGEQSARTVLATIVGSGSKVLVEITIDPTTERDAPEGETLSVGAVQVDAEGAGIPGPVAAGDVVIATDEHPFWVPDLKAWVDAVDLVPGMWLQTSAGTWVQINAIQAWSQSATVHNLTVQGVHTYHVATGSLDVLNHNCDEWSSKSNLNEHDIKHRVEMGFESSAEYESASQDLMCDCDGGRPGVERKFHAGDERGPTIRYFDSESGEYGMKGPKVIINYYNLDGGSKTFNRMPGIPWQPGMPSW